MGFFNTSSSFLSLSGLIYSKKHHFGIQRTFPLPEGDSQLGSNHSLTHSALAGGAVQPIHTTPDRQHSVGASIYASVSGWDTVTTSTLNLNSV